MKELAHPAECFGSTRAKGRASKRMMLARYVWRIAGFRPRCLTQPRPARNKPQNSCSKGGGVIGLARGQGAPKGLLE